MLMLYVAGGTSEKPPSRSMPSDLSRAEGMGILRAFLLYDTKPNKINTTRGEPRAKRARWKPPTGRPRPDILFRIIKAPGGHVTHVSRDFVWVDISNTHVPVDILVFGILQCACPCCHHPAIIGYLQTVPKSAKVAVSMLCSHRDSRVHQM